MKNTPGILLFAIASVGLGQQGPTLSVNVKVVTLLATVMIETAELSRI